MKLSALMTVAAISGLIATGAWSTDYKVKRTIQLPVSTTQVWSLIGDFCDIDDWHPDIKACMLKVIDGRLHRVLTDTDGSESVQQRIAVEPGLSYTYKILSSPLPLEKYTATFSIEPHDGSRVTWSARFSTDDLRTGAAIAEMYDTGLSAIASVFEKD